MSGWPDPNRAHALIIGTSSYQDERYANLPSAVESARRIGAMVAAGEIWRGIPGENVEQLVGEVTVREAARAIAKKVKVQNLSALLVYICGHGQRWTEDHVPDRHLHFAFSDSNQRWSFTHLPFLAVRRMLTDVPRSAATLLIIDCCYANGAFLAGEGEAEVFDVQGVWTMVATRWPVRAPASWPGTEYTAFSGAMIEIIEKGISGPEQNLTPDSVFRALRQRLHDQGKPEPDARGNGTQVFLCRNNSYEPPQDRSSFSDLTDGLGDNDIDLARYAEAVADGDATGQCDEAAQLVAEFCARRTVTDTVGLAAVLRSKDLGGYADQAIGGIYTCRPGAEIAELAHLLHRQADLDIDGVLNTLSGRQADVIADFRAALYSRACDDCSLIDGQINARILGVWPSARLDELLGALHFRDGKPVRSSHA